jgi:putative oxidoreductase
MQVFLEKLLAALNWIGTFFPQLTVRALLAWEFWESGLEKYHGENWFAHIQDKFLFPFNVVPTDISWFMATWFELVGGIFLLVGLATRFTSLSLVILTVIAVHAVHWPAEWNSFSELLQGYSISKTEFGNYKLPLIYLVLFTVPLFIGPGKLSLDHLIWGRRRRFN